MLYVMQLGHQLRQLKLFEIAYDDGNWVNYYKPWGVTNKNSNYLST